FSAGTAVGRDTTRAHSKAAGTCPTRVVHRRAATESAPAEPAPMTGDRKSTRKPSLTPMPAGAKRAAQPSTYAAAKADPNTSGEPGRSKLLAKTQKAPA